jgi:hypothetical protein
MQIIKKIPSTMYRQLRLHTVPGIFFNINRIDMITHWFCFFDQWLYPYWPDPALPLTIQVAGGFQ